MTKNVRHYENRLFNHGNPYEEFLNRNKFRLNHDVIFGTGARHHQNDLPVKAGKKLYSNIRWASEIGETNAIKAHEEG